MRRHIVICLAATAFLSGCAYQGVLVEKHFRPLPFSESLGVDAMYNFQLRDNTGQVHSQMVTPAVFASYRAGDYFSDLQSPPSHVDKELDGFSPAPWEMNEGPYQPVRVMQIRPPGKTAVRVAAHSNRSIKSATKVVVHSNLPIKSATKAAIPSNLRVKSTEKIAVHSNSSVQRAIKVAVHSNSSIKRVANVAVHSDHSTKSRTKVAVRSNQHAKRSAKMAKSNNLGNDTSQIVHHKKKVAKVTTAHRKHRETVASLN